MAGFCEYDGRSLAGKRADARFCEPRCRKAFGRNARRPKEPLELGPPIVQAAAPDLSPGGYLANPWEQERKQEPEKPAMTAERRALVNYARKRAGQDELPAIVAEARTVPLGDVEAWLRERGIDVEGWRAKRALVHDDRGFGFRADSAFDESHGPDYGEPRYKQQFENLRPYDPGNPPGVPEGLRLGE